MKLLLFAQPHETESLRALSDCLFLEELQQATRLDSISFSQLGRRLSQLPILTNRFDMSADEMSQMYKSRWAIELFFK